MNGKRTTTNNPHVIGDSKQKKYKRNFFLINKSRPIVPPQYIDHSNPVCTSFMDFFFRNAVEKSKWILIAPGEVGCFLIIWRRKSSKKVWNLAYFHIIVLDDNISKIYGNDFQIKCTMRWSSFINAYSFRCYHSFFIQWIYPYSKTNNLL